MKGRSIGVRRLKDGLVRALATLAALVGIAFLVWILYVVLARGISAINWDFFTERPAPPGMVGGGMASAILGTLWMTGLAVLLGVPAGLLAGVYLAEFGQNTRFGEAVRFTSNMLMGTPSIIIGVFIYIIMVVPMNNFTGYAGAVALAVIMLPVVTRTTEDMLTLVPSALRESALALGSPRWKVTLGVVFRAARNGLVTGTLLAIARVTGETAPLLFTALNSPYWPTSLNEPTGNLTVTIFNYAMSPYPDWQAMAWGASFLITAGVLGATVFTRSLLWFRSQ